MEKTKEEIQIEASNMEEAVFQLFSEGILTKTQRYHCDKKLRKWSVKKDIKWNKKIRE